MDEQPRRRYFSYDGLKLHYWEWGDPREETYVFVHGVRDQGRSWEHFLASLRRRGVSIRHFDEFATRETQFVGQMLPEVTTIVASVREFQQRTAHSRRR